MVLPKEIGDAAQDADAARVKAWLDSGGDINDGDEENYTLIHCCAIGTPDEEQVTSANVSLAQTLSRVSATTASCGTSSRTGAPQSKFILHNLDARAATHSYGQPLQLRDDGVD